MRISPAAQKLLDLNKKSIILSLSYKRRMGLRTRLCCCNSFVHLWQANFLRDSWVHASPWPLKVTLTLKKLTFIFFSIHWKKNVHVQNAYGSAPRTTSLYMAPFCISIVIIKSHNFQTPFYQILDDFLILARFVPSRALSCLLDHARIWLEPRQASLHPY